MSKLNLTQSFSACAQQVFLKNKEKIFLTVKDKERSIEFTYKQFEHDVTNAITYLNQSCPKAQVLICWGRNSYNQTVHIMAGLLAGVTVYPISSQESADSIESRKQNLNLRNDEIAFFSDLKLESAEASGQNIFKAQKKNRDLFFINSSGTTGKAKIVMQNESAVLANCDQLIRHFSLDKKNIKIGTSLSISHVNCLNFSFLCAFLTGNQLVLLEQTDISSLKWLIERSDCQIISLIPSLYRLILSLGHRIDCRLNPDCYFISAAAPLPIVIWKDFYTKTGHYIRQGYGLSEVVNFSTLMSLEISTELMQECYVHEDRLSIGSELESNSVQILRADGSFAGPEEPGEIAIFGTSLTRGYYPNGFDPNEQIQSGIKTGDLGFYKLDQKDNLKKYFYINGRIKEIIKKSGQSIGLSEIDSMLINCLDANYDAIAIAYADDIHGENFGILFRGSKNQQVVELCRNYLIEQRGPLFSFEKVIFVDTEIRTISGKPCRHLFAEDFRSKN